MNIPELSARAAADRSSSDRFQVRVRSEAPTLIEDAEIVTGSLAKARVRCYVLVRRTSYMVNGPNREVLWAIDGWNPKRQKWETVVSGKSTLAAGSAPW